MESIHFVSSIQPVHTGKCSFSGRKHRIIFDSISLFVYSMIMSNIQCCIQGLMAQGQGLVNWSLRTRAFLEDYNTANICHIYNNCQNYVLPTVHLGVMHWVNLMAGLSMAE